MNGKELELITKLFDERHDDNKGKFQTIFGKLDNIVNKLGELPCKGHKADLVWLIWGFRFIYLGIITGLSIVIKIQSAVAR